MLLRLERTTLGLPNLNIYGIYHLSFMANESEEPAKEPSHDKEALHQFQGSSQGFTGVLWKFFKP